MPTKGQHKPFLINPTKEHLAFLQSKGQLKYLSYNLSQPSRGKRRGRGITTGRGKGNKRGQMPNGRGNVGNGTTEMSNKPSSSQPLPSSSSSQPLFYTGATSSSSQPPNIADIKRFKSSAKRFKSPAKRFKSPAKRFKSSARSLDHGCFEENEEDVFFEVVGCVLSTC
ncbi:unnamed protein product [Prunus armeniaca]|uniref:Uncharacterized protein n=1 Tax=Prunus armeniaca TaxID=36596 RepID=A0A6J5X2D4_PRUAR|nr:unnamed protein product [Prunus armeniaca]